MDFFGYYTIDDPAKHPFMMFSTTHLLFIILIICCIYLGLKVSKDYPEEKIKRIEKIVSASLIFGEFIYYIWNIFKCPYPIFTEILPLHLCSICIWTSSWHSGWIMKNCDILSQSIICLVHWLPYVIRQPLPRSIKHSLIVSSISSSLMEQLRLWESCS